MNPLEEVLGALRGARWLGHVGGLAAYGMLALAGMGGELAWLPAVFLAGALLGVELLLSLADARGRRLRAIARQAVPVQSLDPAQRQALQQGLLSLPGRALGRSALAWAAACAGLRLVGVSWPGALLLLAAGAPLAGLLQARVLALRVQRALPYFELGADPAAALAPWLPSLNRRLWSAALWPLGVALAPVAALAWLGQAPSLALLGADALLGLAAAAACAAALRRSLEEPLDALHDALHRLAQGDPSAPLAVTDAGLLGRLAQEGRAAMHDVGRRERAWRQWGQPLPPGATGGATAATLRPVAVLALRWDGAAAALASLDPVARLGALKRLAQAFEKAVAAQGGWVAEAGPGRWVAVWGAAWAVPEPVQGALAAAWDLGSLLPVLAQQSILRDAIRMDWGLGLASGMAACGLGGAQGRDHLGVQGGPWDEAWALARAEGPWLDERSAGAAKAPFAATLGPQGLKLSQGPDIQVLPGLTLGFEPGQRL
jgi:HAMP domain-containing protein